MHGLVAVDGDIVLDARRIDPTAVFQHDFRLALKERCLAKTLQVPHGAVLQSRYDLWNVGNLLVESFSDRHPLAGKTACGEAHLDAVAAACIPIRFDPVDFEDFMPRHH
jgi:hypothetical protein